MHEWREIVVEAGLGLDEVAFFALRLEAWLARTGCKGDEAERVLGLWGAGGWRRPLTLDKIAINAVKGA